MAQVFNEAQQTLLVNNLVIADQPWQRIKGLLGKKDLPCGNGLLITPCNSIHSFFMRFSFDAVFLDKDYTVVYIVENMEPFRVSRIIRQAEMVLELPAGTVTQSKTTIGDKLHICSLCSGP
jgi:uncharacterized membrane protein (UPF0127 family)